jgi:hypothetical protein
VRKPSSWRSTTTTTVLLVAAVGAALGQSASGAQGPLGGPTPGIDCAPGSLPETTQGRAPAADVASGRYAKGYTCNVAELSHVGKTGGYRVERYVDAAGHECAFWDSTLLYPSSVPDQGADGPGTYVMDMKDPAKPVITSVLRTGAMSSPHESLRLNQKRGLLAANFAYPTFQPGFVDIYDVSKDCRTPELLTSAPTGVLGHEGGFTPDGNTYWVASLYGHTLTALDISNPRVPTPVFFTDDYQPHGVSISDDGKTLYMAEGQFGGTSGYKGLTILDVSQVQARVTNPSVPIVSRLTWPNVGTPQNATPFTRGGHPYLLEIDEFGSGANIGAGRIIDIKDPKKPFVVSNLRLAVNEPGAQGDDLEADPGNDQQFQGYQGHYCSLPSRVDPTVIACTFIMSGLRVFDISNLARPKEIAYHSRPVVPGSVPNQPMRAGSFAMAAPAYDAATGDIWYSDGNSGFYVVRLVGPAKRKSFSGAVVNPGN